MIYHLQMWLIKLGAIKSRHEGKYIEQIHNKSTQMFREV